MPKYIIKQFFLCVIAIVIAGCATGKAGVTTKAYVDDKPRVDQEMEGGNYGYLSGTPIPADRSKLKKTRKVYVLEFTKEVDQPEDPTPPPRVSRSSVDAQRRQSPPPEWSRPIELPDFDDVEYEEESFEGVDTEFVQYTIQKNDTLQKISKKFYGFYSKWPVIQEANPEALKNPNKIKPGTTIRIPVEE